MMKNKDKRLPFYVGKKIKAARLDKHYTQKQLAEISGLTRSQISQWESECRNPMSNNFQRIADALEISYEELLHYGERALPKQQLDSADTPILENYKGLIIAMIDQLSLVGLNKVIDNTTSILKEGGENLLSPPS